MDDCRSKNKDKEADDDDEDKDRDGDGLLRRNTVLNLRELTSSSAHKSTCAQSGCMGIS
jgi:hypothetical protein